MTWFNHLNRDRDEATALAIRKLEGQYPTVPLADLAAQAEALILPELWDGDHITIMAQVVQRIRLRTGELCYTAHLDERDTAIALERVQQRLASAHPAQGDYILMDGEYHRIAYDWGDGLYQFECGAGSYYLGNGYASHSGGLEPGVRLPSLKPAGQKRAPYWFFHHDMKRSRARGEPERSDPCVDHGLASVAPAFSPRTRREGSMERMPTEEEGGNQIMARRRTKKPIPMFVCPNGGHVYLGKICGVCWVMGLNPDALGRASQQGKGGLSAPARPDDLLRRGERGERMRIEAERYATHKANIERATQVVSHPDGWTMDVQTNPQ